MKNQLGDMPDMDLEEELLEEDKLPQHEIEEIPELVPEEVESEGPVDSFAQKDKMNKTITIILIASISIVVVILLGFGIKKLVDKYNANKLFDENQKNTSSIGIETKPGDEEFGDSDLILTDPWNPGSQISSKKRTFQGVEVVGDLIIPSIKLNLPILYKTTDTNLDKSITLSQGALNEPPVAFVEGHNYKNDKFFSNLYNVQVGDKLTVKDEKSKRSYEYEVYEVVTHTDQEKGFLHRNTNNLPEITLSTCSDNVVNRTVVHARLTPGQLDQE